MQPIFASLWWWRSPMMQKTATLTSICFSSIDGVNKSSHGSLDTMILSNATFAAATTVAISLLRPLSCKHACDIDNYFYSRRDAIVGNQISREEWRVRQNDNCKVQYTDLGRCRLTIVTISNKDNVSWVESLCSHHTIQVPLCRWWGPLLPQALFFFAAVVFTLFAFALASLTHLGRRQRGGRVFAHRKPAILEMG